MHYIRTYLLRGWPAARPSRSFYYRQRCRSCALASSLYLAFPTSLRARRQRRAHKRDISQWPSNARWRFPHWRSAAARFTAYHAAWRCSLASYFLMLIHTCNTHTIGARHHTGTVQARRHYYIFLSLPPQVDHERPSADTFSPTSSPAFHMFPSF